MGLKVFGLDNERSLQDKAYDLLGEMLVERDTARYMRELEEDVAHGNTAEMDAFFAKQDKVNLKKIEAYNRKQRGKHFLRHTLPRIAQAVAIVVAVISLAGGVAVAASHTVRVQVMQLLLSIEEEYTKLRLVEDENASFDVPADWQGSSFPTYIPEGMEVFECISSWNYNDITYRDIKENTVKVRFLEAEVSPSTKLDTEDTAVQAIMIQGYDGCIAVKGNSIQIFWSDGLNYYIVTTHGVEENTSITIAQSVRKIK